MSALQLLATFCLLVVGCAALALVYALGLLILHDWLDGTFNADHCPHGTPRREYCVACALGLPGDQA